MRLPSKIIKNSYNLLKKYKQKKILVIGGGYGRNAAFLAKRGFVITNSDVSANALSLGKRIYKQVNNLRFKKDDILRTKNTKSSFDAIFALYLLSLFTNQEVQVALKNIRKILRSNGILICNFLSTTDDEYSLGEKVNNDQFLHDNQQQLVHFYTKSKVRKLLIKSKFSIDKIYAVSESRYINTLGKKVTSRSMVVVARR